jgi:SAM-dependent methyltransferase
MTVFEMTSSSLNAPKTPTQATACLACGHPLPTPTLDYFDTRFGHDDSYGIAACPGCGLEQTLPRPDAPALVRLYETYYNFGGESGTLYARARELFLNSFLYRAWLAIDGDVSFHRRRGSGHLLDYGCNEGRGLGIYRRNGYDVEGLELNPRAAERARARGFQVTSESLENFSPASPFDVIILSNVLEHALEPKDMLAHARRLLSPGGQVWVSCPNSNSWLRRAMGRYWINWHVPFHIVHFTQASLCEMLARSGFDVLEKKQVTPSLWVVQSLLAKRYAKKGIPTVQLHSTVLVAGLMLLCRGFLFPWIWLNNLRGCGDCLVVIAEKKSSNI